GSSIWYHSGYRCIHHFRRFRQPAKRCISLFRHSLLRLRLHDWPQTHLDTKYSHRWCRWSGTCAGWLGCHYKQLEPASNLALCHHLLLDTSALLGTFTVGTKRLREGWYTHAAGSQGRGRDTATNSTLFSSCPGCDARS